MADFVKTWDSLWIFPYIAKFILANIRLEEYANEKSWELFILHCDNRMLIESSCKVKIMIWVRIVYTFDKIIFFKWNSLA